jgi:hypothetical protein
VDSSFSKPEGEADPRTSPIPDAEVDVPGYFEDKDMEDEEFDDSLSESDVGDDDSSDDEDKSPADDDSPTTCGMCGDILDDDEIEDLNGVCYRCTNSHLKAIIEQQNDTNEVLLKKLREAHEEIGALKIRISMCGTFTRGK